VTDDSVNPRQETPPMPHYLPAAAPDDIAAWQQTVVAFLAEKERRSGFEPDGRKLRPDALAVPH
jgi:hypothetical protein